jgi:2,4-dienoyl-CoA reductase-like NADH-dependent reductase (Old Yellow Enzyme family)
LGSVTPHLFEPLEIRSQTLANRLWVAPMCQYSAVDGFVQPWHSVHLGALAVGGPGLIITEKTAVLPDGRITPACPGIWDTERQAAWEPIVAFAAERGVPMGIQLGHAGRKGSTYPPDGGPVGTVPRDAGGWETLGPSAAAFGTYAAPREMDGDDLRSVVRAFGDAARRSEDAGFSVIEIHAAHGYLLHQFLSPLSNLRDDAYGGSLEGRARLLYEVVESVRGAISDGVPLFVRLSATDWVPGGLEVEDIVAIVSELEARGIDLFDMSSGGNDARQQIPLAPGYQVPFASAVKAVATVPVTAVGLLTEPTQMEQVLADGDADAIFVAREFLRDRLLPLRAAAQLGVEAKWPWQYERAKPRRAS